jgi:organic radical activating enzyme
MLLSRLPNGAPEIFRTVQGEGPSAGVPAVFVRLAECNLRCTWCDTAYTWDWSRHDREKETIEIDDVVARVRAHASAATTVVFTGGEPLLQQDEIAKTTSALDGFRIEIETNGTITPDGTLATRVDQWNVSPKLASSGNAERARLRPAALGWFATSQRAFFKACAHDGVAAGLVAPADADAGAAAVLCGGGTSDWQRRVCRGAVPGA